MVTNFFVEYVNTCRKNLYKYLKFIFKKDYDEQIAERYIETYINARYYNLSYKENNRVFYLRIKEALIKTMEKLLKENEKVKERTGDYVNYRRKEKIIGNMLTAFDYIFFFDKVRDVENMKKINSIRKVIDNLYERREHEYLIKERISTKEEFNSLVKTDMINNEIYLDKYFDDNTFELEIKKIDESVYEVEIISNVQIPMIYSEAAIKMTYNSEIVREERLLPEYALLSLLVTRDIVEANFKDQYIVEFPVSLLRKTKKLEQTLLLLNDPALQDKINLKIKYEKFIKNKDKIFALMKQGYRFVLELDNEFTNVEEIRKLEMFSYIIVNKKLKCYKPISAKYKNAEIIIYK